MVLKGKERKGKQAVEGFHMLLSQTKGNPKMAFIHCPKSPFHRKRQRWGAITLRKLNFELKEPSQVLVLASPGKKV